MASRDQQGRNDARELHRAGVQQGTPTSSSDDQVLVLCSEIEFKDKTNSKQKSTSCIKGEHLREGRMGLGERFAGNCLDYRLLFSWVEGMPGDVVLAMQVML